MFTIFPNSFNSRFGNKFALPYNLLLITMIVLDCCLLSYITNSQDSVVTCIRYGGSSNRFTASLLQSLSLKEFGKSVKR